MELSPTLAALAETKLDPGATVRPESLGDAPTAHAGVAPPGAQPTNAGVAPPGAQPINAGERGPSPFQTGLVTLPPVQVRFPGARPGGPALDLEIKGVLAEGGMGRVYVAEQRTLAREVAIKTVKDVGDAGQTNALLWEGAITGHLDFPGVTPVHILGADEAGRPLLVMKRIVGLRWTELLELPAPWERVSTLPKERLRAHVEILMEICRTVHYAHTRGVLHLDLKPDNVMVGDLGDVYLVDWGVATTLDAAAAQRGAFAGTPCFVAPEVVAGEEVGPWTDVYLLGAILHVVLTGRPRHGGHSLREVLERALESPPFAYDASVPGELARLANAATSRASADRPKDALAFRAALAEYLEHVASMRLSGEGSQRLAELRLVEGGAWGAREVRLVTEARFAFRAALERWAENAEASAGLSASSERAVRIELARENLVGAREAAAELAAVPPALAQELAELEARLQRRVESEAEVQRVRGELDLGRGARTRTIGLSVLCVLLTVATVAGGGLEPIDLANVQGATLGDFLAMPLGFAVVLVLGVATVGRSALQNAIGRRTVAVLFVTSVGTLLHRAAIFSTGPAGVHIPVGDLVFIAAALSPLAVFVRRAAWLVVAVVLAGAVALMRWPTYATAVFNATAIVAMATSAWALRGLTPARAPEPGAGS